MSDLVATTEPGRDREGAVARISPGIGYGSAILGPSAAPAAGVRARRLPWPVGCVLLFFFLVTAFGKGPTYLGLPPLYISEMALGVGLLWLIDTEGVSRTFWPEHSVMVALLACLLLLGSLILITDVGKGIEAFRDAAMWYYGLFFYIGYRLARDPMGDRVWRILCVAWACALVWGTFDQVTLRLTGVAPSTFGPTLPWRGEKLLFNSTNELVEHMMLATLILFNPRLHRGQFGLWRLPLTLVSVAALAEVAVSRGRGVKVGVALSVLLLVALRFAPGKALTASRRVAAAAVLAVVVSVGGLAFYTDEFLRLTQLDRFAHADPSSASGTAYWRLVWWKRLWTVVNEQNPAFGLGFGDSLNIYNPYLHGDENNKWPVRSPHNYNVTVFARMGYVGAALWASILVMGLAGLFRRAWRGRAPDGELYSEERRDEIAFWISVMIITWINATFGVLMEGPVLGPWFWLALGLGWARSSTSGRVRSARQAAIRTELTFRPSYGGVIA
ncbi:MAG: O-antigen ligase family protein [Bryobacteraceae bacterium]